MDELLKQLRQIRPDLADSLGDAPTEEAVRAALARANAEAAPAMTLADRLDAVRRAVSEKYSDSMAMEPRRYAWACMVYDDSVVVEKGGQLFQVSYSIDDAGVVTFSGEPVPVRLTPQPINSETGESAESTADAVAARLKTIRDAKPFDGFVLRPVAESAGAQPDGSVWDIVVIQAGESLNRRLYTEDVLAAAAPLYDRVPIYRNHNLTPGPHGRDVDEAIGFIADPRGVRLAAEANGDSAFAITARAHIVDPAFQAKLLNAWNAGHPNLFGFSHVVESKSQVIRHNGRAVERMEAITAVKSVDLVMNPAAGGRVLRVSEAVEEFERQSQEDTRMLEQLIARLKAVSPERAEALGKTPTEAEVLDAIFAAMPAKTDAAPKAEAKTESQPKADAATAEAQAAEAASTLALHKRVAKSDLSRLVSESQLPPTLKARIKKRFETRIDAAAMVAALPQESEIAEAIQDEVQTYGELFEKDVKLPGGGGLPRITFGEGRVEKIQKQWDDFFDPSKPAQSVRRLYLETTGDDQFLGRIENARLLAESIGSGTFDKVLSNSINRQLLAAYKASPLANWRQVVTVDRAGDFRPQIKTRIGGYGNLSEVAEGQPYPALTTPGDESVSISVSKRGGTESVTLEAIRNDDVGALRRIPGLLAQAAAQTLHEFVWDFFATNPTIYDSTALIASGHNNIVTTALSDSNIETLRTKMKKQTNLSNGKRLGIPPRFLITGNDLEKLAWQLTRSPKQLADSNLAAQAEPAALSFTAQMGLVPITVEYWTDANDYFLCADPALVQGLTLMFLDGNEDPQLFVQDLPNVGSMFSNDKLTWKIRHIYGAGWVDYRGVAGGIVS
jgi:hypothetical protein